MAGVSDIYYKCVCVCVCVCIYIYIYIYIGIPLLRSHFEPSIAFSKIGRDCPYVRILIQQLAIDQFLIKHVQRYQNQLYTT